MTKNICSPVDKTIRVIVGLAILGAGLIYQNWWGLLGLEPLLTVAYSWSPLYALFGVNTCSISHTPA